MEQATQEIKERVDDSQEPDTNEPELWSEDRLKTILAGVILLSKRTRTNEQRN